MTTYTIKNPCGADLKVLFRECILMGKTEKGYEFIRNPNEDLKVQE